ncbi:MAG: carbohydrate ABC transporter permease [Ruthenibacterium lactatiformans]
MQKRYHTLENIIFDAIVYLVMAFVLICCLVPFIYMLAVSFSGTKPLINGEVFLWPKDFTLDSYKQIFTYPNFFKAYGNTFLYAVGGTAIALIMTSLMAYPLSKTFLWGNKFFTKMVVVTMFFSGGLIPNYLLLNSLHLVGTRAAMLMPFAINSFNLIILINFFRSIPNEIEEAALIDGLGYFGILRRIVLPLSTAAIATIGLYYAVFFWNDWFNSLIYLKSDQYPCYDVPAQYRERYHGHRHRQRLGGKDDHCHLGEIRGHHHIHRTHYRDLSLPSEIFRQGLDHWGRKGMSAFPSSAEPTKGYASHEEAVQWYRSKRSAPNSATPIRWRSTARILRRSCG